MIQSNELRLNNIIESGDGIGQVTAIETDWVTTTSNNLSLPVESYTGTPLTEQWLIKLGFTETISNYYWRTFFTPDQFSCSIAMRDKDPGGLNKGQMIAGSKNVPVQFVHDLQNAYFASCGKELKLVE